MIDAEADARCHDTVIFPQAWISAYHDDTGKNRSTVQAEMCHAQRMFPMAMLPWWDVDPCVAEIERAHRMGLKGLNITSDPHMFRRPDGSMLPEPGQGPA